MRINLQILLGVWLIPGVLMAGDVSRPAARVNSAATSVRTGSEEVGLASYYHDKYHGRQTASGEIFDTHRLTAAHRTLPFGTIVRVTDPTSNRTVTVRINDRGPFVPGRVIDLSRAAARVLQMEPAGLTKVKVEVLATVGSRARN